MNKTSMSELFAFLGYDYKTLPVNSPIDVGSRGVLIRGYNTETKNVEESKLLKIIRKIDDDGYCVTVLSTGVNFLGASNHLIYACTSENMALHYLPLKVLSKEDEVFALTDRGCIERVSVEPAGDIEVLDIEVEGNHNYFSAGVLSHNTMFGSPEVTCVTPKTMIEIEMP